MIRIMIADDHAIVRAGLKQIVGEISDMEVAGEAASGQEALALARRGNLDVVLLDLSMPGRGGMDALRQLKKEQPDLPVLILSIYAEDQYALRALKAGAAGYLTKDGAPDELVVAIRRAAAGRRYIRSSLAEKLAGELAGDTRQAAARAALRPGIPGDADARLRQNRGRDCQRALPQRQDYQYQPCAPAAQDGPIHQCRADLLRRQAEVAGMTPRRLGRLRGRLVGLAPTEKTPIVLHAVNRAADRRIPCQRACFPTDEAFTRSERPGRGRREGATGPLMVPRAVRAARVPRPGCPRDDGGVGSPGLNARREPAATAR